MFEENIVQCIATLHYSLIPPPTPPKKKNEITLSILVLCLYACKLPTQNESSMFCASLQFPFHKDKAEKNIHEDYEICSK